MAAAKAAKRSMYEICCECTNAKPTSEMKLKREPAEKTKPASGFNICTSEMRVRERGPGPNSAINLMNEPSCESTRAKAHIKDQFAPIRV